MKKWLIDRFLPMWAKETVLQDNRALARQKEALIRENECLRAYIKGLERGIRRARRTIKEGDAT